jgi:methionyl-tRNA formyltransferase
MARRTIRGMKIIFAGTPEFAAVALRALHAAGFAIPLVLTQPDRPGGRGMRLQPSAVKNFALENNIAIAQPVSLRLDGKYPDVARETHDQLHRTPHDVMVVAAYGLILPESVLQIPPLGCINIHASLLPRWRGAAPIHRAIEAGDEKTGVAIMQMERGLDTGPTLAMRDIVIAAHDSTGTLHDRLAALGAEMIVDVLHEMKHGRMVTTPQAEAGVTYAAKIGKEEAALDFSQAAISLDRKIRAFDPFPGALAHFNGTPVKIWRGEAIGDGATAALPGTVLAADAQAGVVVATGQGALRMLELQKPGGRRLPALEFIKAFPLADGRFS